MHTSARHLMMLFSAVLLVLAGCQFDTQEAEILEEDLPETPMTARAALAAADDLETAGEVMFTHHEEGVRIEAFVDRLGQDSLYTLYIHEEGDCSAPDAQSMGAPFDPTVAAGAPSTQQADRPAGRVGTLQPAPDQTARFNRIDGALDLDGPNAIVNRAIVLWGDAADAAEAPGPGTGTAVACGVIELVDPAGIPDTDDVLEEGVDPREAPAPGQQPEPDAQPENAESS